MVVEFKKEETIEIINSISDLTNLAIVVIDNNGVDICGSGPRYHYCDRMNEMLQNRSVCVNCDKELMKKCDESGKMEYHVCHAGLYDFAMPIIKNGVIAGHILMGRIRVRNSEPVKEYTLYDDGTLYDLYYKLPKLSMEQIEALPVLFSKIDFGKCVILSENSELEKIEDYIRDHLKNKLTAEEICNEFGISKAKLYRMFKRERNMAFNRFVVEQRIIKANDLLLYDENTIGMIAKEVGYANQSYFVKVYKEVTGKSPRQVRKKLKNVY